MSLTSNEALRFPEYRDVDKSNNTIFLGSNVKEQSDGKLLPNNTNRKPRSVESTPVPTTKGVAVLTELVDEGTDNYFEDPVFDSHEKAKTYVSALFEKSSENDCEEEIKVSVQNLHTSSAEQVYRSENNHDTQSKPLCDNNLLSNERVAEHSVTTASFDEENEEYSTTFEEKANDSSYLDTVEIVIDETVTNSYLNDKIKSCYAQENQIISEKRGYCEDHSQRLIVRYLDEPDTNSVFDKELKVYSKSPDQAKRSSSTIMKNLNTTNYHFDSRQDVLEPPGHQNSKFHPNHTAIQLLRFDTTTNKNDYNHDEDIIVAVEANAPKPHERDENDSYENRSSQVSARSGVASETLERSHLPECFDVLNNKSIPQHASAIDLGDYGIGFTQQRQSESAEQMLPSKDFEEKENEVEALEVINPVSEVYSMSVKNESHHDKCETNTEWEISINENRPRRSIDRIFYNDDDNQDIFDDLTDDFSSPPINPDSDCFLENPIPRKKAASKDVISSEKNTSPSKTSGAFSMTYRPTYFTRAPTSIVDAYNEYKGLGRFTKPPGGVEKFDKHVRSGRKWSSLLAGSIYPCHRIVKAMANKIDEIPSVENRYKELEKLDAELKENSKEFWRFLQNYSKTKGKLPFDKAEKVKVETGKVKNKTKQVESDDTHCKPLISAESNLTGNESLQVAGKRIRTETIAISNLPDKRVRREIVSLKEDGDENAAKVVQESFFDVSCKDLTLIENPHNEYKEETAFLYYEMRLKQTDTDDDIPPLPPPPPLPSIPDDLSEIWTIDEESRVLLGNFTKLSKHEPISEQSKIFLFDMMQRDDITVISEGLLDFDVEYPEKWLLAEVGKLFGDHYYHKFRRFERRESEDGAYEELDGFVSMRVSDFLQYLAKRERVVDHSDEDCFFAFFDVEGKETIIENVSKVVLYMIDVEIETNLRGLDEKFSHFFRLNEVVPGGKKCMMSWMPRPSRPFMGPNMYITPGGGFTHFHQDGHGTVDSGHCNIAGFNEVVMLRRMPECHKRNATRLLPQKENGKNIPLYDPLYSYPHSDIGVQGKRPDWPRYETIEKWKHLNYCPSVFILKPNQHVHINKGRIHAFRKATPDTLPTYDCHFKLREQLMEKLNESKMSFPPVCISIAWDWMYTGFNAEGINREVSTILECSAYCRQNMKKSLATPEVALFYLASYLAQSFVAEKKYDENMFQLCRGILPSYEFLVKRELRASLEARQRVPDVVIPPDVRDRDVLSLDRQVDINKSPDLCSVNPRGNDYFCKLCYAELSNVYFHCDGCEVLLSKDFDICIQCYSSSKYKCLYIQHPRKTDRHSLVNHTGVMPKDNRVPCTCKKGPKCSECGRCTGCSCRCHTWFTMHWRNETDEGLKTILSTLKKVVKNDAIEYAKETIMRLDFASHHLESDWVEKLTMYVQSDKQRVLGSFDNSINESFLPDSKTSEIVDV